MKGRKSKRPLSKDELGFLNGVRKFVQDRSKSETVASRFQPRLRRSATRIGRLLTVGLRKDNVEYTVRERRVREFAHWLGALPEYRTFRDEIVPRMPDSDQKTWMSIERLRKLHDVPRTSPEPVDPNSNTD